VVRENTEGEYSAVGGRMFEGTEREFVLQESVFTRHGTDRILKYAFELAQRRPKKHLTAATKSNGIAISMPYWDERVAAMGESYPDVKWDKYHVDILAARFVLSPERFDVVVASNLFGDILSDLGPACTGTIGIAPSANLDPERNFPSLFEPVHGSAPDIYGKNIANPIAMIWSGAMMLEFLGYKDKEELEALQMGSVQMLAPTFGKFGPMGVREFEVFDLPYLFDNMAQAQKVTQGPIGHALLKKLDAKGLTGLAMWDSGFLDWTSNKPIQKPADIKGMKIRIQSSKVIDARTRVVGALPQVMPWSEIYQGLQTGVVDGQENPPSIVSTAKLFEVQKFMTISEHGYHGYVFIANKRFWDALPADLKPVMDKAVKDATEYFNSNAKKENDDALEDIRKTGKMKILTMTPEEKNEWKAIQYKVHREMEDRIGKDLIQSIYKEIGRGPDGK
jgi:C4-dicarboxylate-binding protein DctP